MDMEGHGRRSEEVIIMQEKAWGGVQQIQGSEVIDYFHYEAWYIITKKSITTSDRYNLRQNF